MAARRKIGLGIVLGWLVPGLGHLYMKRHVHGALYALCIGGLFAAGLLLARGTAVNFEIHPWYFTCQAFAGPVTFMLEFLRGPEAINLGESVGILEHQTGVVYVATAGVLNLVTLAELYRRHVEPTAPGPADTMRKGST